MSVLSGRLVRFVTVGRQGGRPRAYREVFTACHEPDQQPGKGLRAPVSRVPRMWQSHQLRSL